MNEGARTRRRLSMMVGFAMTAALAAIVIGEPRAAETISVAPVLAPLVKAISRPVYTYHYAMRVRLGLGERGYVPPNDPGRDQYVSMRIARFWDLSIPTARYATASGLYTGIDPIVPRAFGGVGDVWAMVQVVLAPGFRVVDVRRWRDARQQRQRFPSPVLAQLRDAGCDAEFPESLLVGLESAACRAIAVRTLRDLDVDGILYTFLRFRFPECPDRPEGGFIVLDDRRLQPERMQLVTPEVRADTATADRLIIEELFVRARRAGSRRDLLWPSLERRRAQVDVDAWMRQHLFGCGAYEEDAMPPDLVPASAPEARRPM